MDRSTFTEEMRTAASQTWQRAVNHRFFVEVQRDSVDDEVFARYLRVEFAFVDTAARVLGYAVAKAPGFVERRYLARGLYGLATDQYDFFVSAFQQLGLPTPEAGAGAIAEPARALHDVFLTTAQEHGYEEILACMLGAEWLYLTWCMQAAKNPSRRPVIRTWVDLHAGGDFARHVEWMRRELDSRGPFLTPERAARVRRLFEQTLVAEISFHNAAYA